MGPSVQIGHRVLEQTQCSQPDQCIQIDQCCQTHCEERSRRPDGLLLHDNAAVELLAWSATGGAPLPAIQCTLHAPRA